VSDDGAGFDPERLSEHLAGGHIGLASQRLRVESAGGEMEIISAPGEGSTIVIGVPSDPAADGERRRGGVGLSTGAVADRP